MILTATLSIARPATEVVAFIADAANNQRWQKGMKSCEWLTTGPTAVGSQCRQRASFVGRPVISVLEVVEFVPGIRIVIETIESTFPIRVERSVEALGPDSCRATAEITGGPRVPRFAQGLVAWPAQRSVSADYDRLEELLES